MCAVHSGLDTWAGNSLRGGGRREGEREERTTEQSAGEKGGGGKLVGIFFRGFFNSSDLRGSPHLISHPPPILLPLFLCLTEVPFCSPGSTPAKSAAALP